MDARELYNLLGLTLFIASPIFLAGFIVFQWAKAGPKWRRAASVLLLYVLFYVLLLIIFLPIAPSISDALIGPAVFLGCGVVLGVVVGSVFSAARGISLGIRKMIRWRRRSRANEEQRLTEQGQNQSAEVTNQSPSRVRNEEGERRSRSMHQDVKNAVRALGAPFYLGREIWHRRRLRAQEQRLAEEQRLAQERQRAEEQRLAEEQERQKQEKIRLREEAERRRRVTETLRRAKERSLLRRRDEEEQRKHIESLRSTNSVMDDYGTRKGKTIEVEWDGPYGWPGFERESNLRPLPKLPGVYLQTFKYKDGYLIYAAGLTRRPVPIRFKQHTRKYLNGEYNVLNIAAARQGVREEIWHGWGYARKHREEFEQRKSIILDAVRKQLAGFRIFITHEIGLGKEERILERLEAAIMNNLYQQPSPIRDIPDRGMHLAPRRDAEAPIIVRNDCAALLYGLPDFLEI